MPRMREAMRSGSNGSRASVFSPTPMNTIGLPVIWRTDERTTAARIAVRLRQDDAGQIQRRTEGASGIDRVLAGHRVDDEQALRGS